MQLVAKTGKQWAGALRVIVAGVKDDRVDICVAGKFCLKIPGQPGPLVDARPEGHAGGNNRLRNAQKTVAAVGQIEAKNSFVRFMTVRQLVFGGSEVLGKVGKPLADIACRTAAETEE